MSFQVVHPGLRTLVEDLGRPGLAALGVGPSGAADRGAHRLANRLVGNPEGAATLEVLAGGLVLEARTATVVAVAGAPLPIQVAGRPVAFSTPVHVAAGEQLELGRPVSGLRSYLAVLGGVDCPQTLGSRSTDTISGLGPVPLAAGDLFESGGKAVSVIDNGLWELAVGPAADVACSAYRGPVGPVDGGPGDASGRATTLSATWGPRADWFTGTAREIFAGSCWTVGADSDRVGVRCHGPRLERAVDGELESEPVVRGSVQIPPSGQPVFFLADHPTTGGYPVIAVLDPGSTDQVAQLRPGDRVRVRVRAAPYPTDLDLEGRPPSRTAGDTSP
ncbi:biotin-dependent carboxyltransferase family protein [Austwickia chelonae]|uniref:5-oxoprolinase subunit C family protein n=1 Tax=Austwickia chelonae TaxID=100225 RepID=UPI000E244379|nr:biotin-dependent carboxyltransferase family protein [Austwickia chelonae]